MFLTVGWVLALTECRRAPPPFWGESAKGERLGHLGLPQDPLHSRIVWTQTIPSPFLSLNFFTSINEQNDDPTWDCCGIKLIQK